MQEREKKDKKKDDPPASGRDKPDSQSRPKVDHLMQTAKFSDGEGRNDWRARRF